MGETIGKQLGTRRTTGADSTAVDTSWRDRASCRLISPDLFFPAGSTGTAIDEIEGAKAVCATCQVQKACLQFALVTNQEAGIWGGTTEDERRRLRRVWLADRRRQAR